MVNLLVVAPAATMQTSLRFLLEADSYDVTAVASLAEAAGFDLRFACTVLDHHAIGPAAEEAVAFVEQHHPVVLLANVPEHPLSAACFSTVSKPQLGAALSQAVRDAIAAGEPAA